MTNWYQTLVVQAQTRDRRAVHTLVKDLEPVVRARVARVLLRRGAGRAHDLREEVRDLVQHVFAHLFAKDCHVLRQWDPEGRASLHNFVGLIAEREAITLLRSRRQSPWQVEEPTVPEDFERGAIDADGPEDISASREVLTELLAAVRAQFSEEALEMFELLVVEERSVEEVCALTGKSAEAIYKWRIRLGQRVAQLAKKILSDRQPPGRIAKHMRLNPVEPEERQ
ncbi:RNA polymerase sigma factor [Sorangium sp. So ce385]|uniref:RNA polymerase sigma factor n=1 Tax=Sorangium sp. So ce385 TaxID=3133308 RepID=UPI003F5BD563